MADKNPALKKILSDNKALSERMVQLELATRLSETTVKLNQLNEAGKFALPPAVIEEARDLAVSLSGDKSAKLLSLLENFTKTGLVELGERGVRIPGSENKSLGEIFIQDVTKLAEDQKISFADAAALVSASDPQGFQAYRQENSNRN